MSGPAPLFDAERMRVYPRIFLATYVLGAIGLLLVARNMVDPWGKPLGYDFITFYAASKLTLAGDPAAAFDLARIFATEKAVVPGSDMAFQWGYPPTFQLLIAPLALLPYGVAYGAFMAGTAAAFFWALRHVPEARPYWLLVVAAPATLLCFFHGQNAFLSAAIFAGGVALFDKRPFWAGALLGLLAFKPQMGLLLPFAFAASGQWRAFLGAALGAGTFAALATAAFGFGLWQAFFDHLGFIQMITRTGMLPWAKMPSAFVAFRLLGLPETVAFAAQTVTTLSVLAIVTLIWRRAGPTPLAWAALITGTLLLMPYMFDYELTLLGLPLALLAADMTRRGAQTSEKAILLLAYAIALPMPAIATATHLQVGFVALMLGFGLCARRTLGTPQFALRALIRPS